MFIFRKSLFSLVRPVLVNVEAGVEVTAEAEEVLVEAEVAEVTTIVVPRVAAVDTGCQLKIGFAEIT